MAQSTAASAFAVLTSLAMLSGCTESPKSEPPSRMLLNRMGGSTFQLVPTENQLPYCLAYTVSRSGLTRQLTMSEANQSFPCSAGKPLGGRTYRVPLNEGPVHVLVFFSSQPIAAASLSQQLLDLPDRQKVSVMDLRLPGKATLELIDYTPEADAPVDVGAVVGEVDAGVNAVAGEDGGIP